MHVWIAQWIMQTYIFCPILQVDRKTLCYLFSCGKSPSPQTEVDVVLDGVKTTQGDLWETIQGGQNIVFLFCFVCSFVFMKL